MRPVVQSFPALQSGRPSPASSMYSANGSIHHPIAEHHEQHSAPVSHNTTPSLFPQNRSEYPHYQPDPGLVAPQAYPDGHGPSMGSMEQEPNAKDLFLQWDSKTNDTTYRYCVSS